MLSVGCEKTKLEIKSGIKKKKKLLGEGRKKTMQSLASLDFWIKQKKGNNYIKKSVLMLNTLTLE